ncbi:MAG: response regulator, partial [Bacteroidales bacterium]|nr:response regulator [Bacteroidales bacterium]
SISKQLIDLLQGMIWLESTENKASTFYFTVPNVKRKPIKKDTDSTGCSSIENPDDPVVLIVEDDKPSFLLIKKYIEKKEINYLWAKNGEEAVEYIQKNNINLVLLDIHLPQMNGYDTFRSIKKINSKIPIIAQTSHADNKSRNKCTEMGFDEILTKPINYRIFELTLDNFLK